MTFDAVSTAHLVPMRFVGGVMDGLRAWESTPPETSTFTTDDGVSVYTQVDVDPDGTLVYRKRG